MNAMLDRYGTDAKDRAGAGDSRASAAADLGRRIMASRNANYRK